MRREFIYFLVAVQVLTRLPVPRMQGFAQRWMERGVKYFPLTGAIVGVACAGVLLAASYLWHGMLPALLTVAAGVLITGGLHEDGFADFFDSMGGATREARLAIMKDSRIGAYGALALGAGVATKIFALAGMPLWIAAVGPHRGARGRAARRCRGDLAPALRGRPLRREDQAAGPRRHQGRPRHRGGFRLGPAGPAAKPVRVDRAGCRRHRRAHHRPQRPADARRLHRRCAGRGRAGLRDFVPAGAGRMRLILVRHPKPLCEPGLCYGRLDLECEPDALDTAALRLGGLAEGCRIVTSPARRARDLAAMLGPDVAVDGRLQELDFGDWEGRRWQDLGREPVEAWQRALPDAAPPGGETLSAMAARCAAWLASLDRRGPPVLAITHAGPIRVIRALPGRRAAAHLFPRQHPLR